MRGGENVKYLTRNDLIQALDTISNTAKTLSNEVKLRPTEKEIKKMPKKFKQCMRCTSKKSIVDDMYYIHGMLICEDCMFNLCQEDYKVQVQDMKLYFDNNGDLIGNSLALDTRDVIRLTLKKHKVEYMLVEPSKKELEY